MNYDKNVQLPEITHEVMRISQQLEDVPLKHGESLFVENFPVEQVPLLNAMVITRMYVGIYVKSDAVYGGSGVRICHMSDIRSQTKPTITKRTIGDWTAPRKSSADWLPRMEAWFGFTFDKAHFYWDAQANRVRVSIDGDMSDISDHCYEINLLSVLQFMSDAGKDYRNGKTVPDKSHDIDVGSASHDINHWSGVKSVVWQYNVTDDIVKQFDTQSDADYEMQAKGVKYEFEDAPLTAWLAYNAAQTYRNQQATDVVSDDELDDL